jgi:hypothetical protein
MKTTWTATVLIALAFLPRGFTRAADEGDVFARKNLVAWCVVPLDAKKRTPAERAEMLARLGFRKVAYDWRDEHVKEFEQEILEYKKHKLDYFAFWGTHDATFELFEKHGLHPQIWVMCPTPEGKTQAGHVGKAAEQLSPVAKRTAAANCPLALYNHGGWGGEPETMVAVVKELREKHAMGHVGIAYNLHHGHDHVDRFPAALAAMKPYLHCLNITGMTKGGDKVGKKIIPLGAGELDVQMLKAIRESGYRGPIGIIGHMPDLDVEERLKDNLNGLDWLLPQLDGKPAGARATWRTYKP